MTASGSLLPLGLSASGASAGLAAARPLPTPIEAFGKVCGEANFEELRLKLGSRGSGKTSA